MGLAMALLAHGAEWPAPQRSVASGRNDVVYLAPATEPYEALPLGNGRLGVMVGSGGGLSFRFYPGNFFASANQNQALIGSGEVLLELPAGWHDGFLEQRLELYNGRIVTRYQAGTVTAWIAEGKDLLVVEIEGNEPLGELRLYLSGWPRPQDQPAPKAVAGEGTVSLVTVGASGMRATALSMKTETTAKVALLAPDQAGVRLTPTGRRQHLLIANPVVIGESVGETEALAAAATLLHSQDVDAMRSLHQRYWHDFWNKTGVVLHSADGTADFTENLYHLFLYWMAGCSRGSDAPKFNGGNYLLHRDWRSWGGAYWYQNTREMYWSLLPSDHADLWAPFVDLYWRHLPRARQLAQDVYGVDGACYEETMQGFDGSGDKAGNRFTHLYLTTGTEMAYQMYTLYLYTHDEEYLRDRAYPLLRETVRYHLHFVNREADGLYHVYPTNSRETWWFVKDAVPDLAALRCVLPILLKESVRLGVDEDQRAHWREVLDHLAPYPLDPDLRTIAPAIMLETFPPTPFARAEQLYQPVEEQRSTAANRKRFNSENAELDPVYPWRQAGFAMSAEDLALWRETYRKRRFSSWGFGNAWDPSSIWAARLGLGEEYLLSLRQFLSADQMFPQGFAGTPGASPPEWGKKLGDSPGLDASGVVAAGVTEILLQTHNEVLYLFPAMPEGWAGEFTLLAEGGFLVQSARDRKGNIPFVTITSRFGGSCRLMNPWTHTIDLLQTTPGQLLRLQPPAPIDVDAPIEVAPASGPKWPNKHEAETADEYLDRHHSFGFLGISQGGGNPARKLVREALARESRIVPIRPIRQLPPRPTQVLPRTEKAPVIDGLLDELLWEQAPPGSRLLELGTAFPAEPETELRAAWDAQNLYLAVRCHEPAMDRLRAEPFPYRDATGIFADDSIELFLQPTSDGPYWHLAINAAGAIYDAWVVDGIHQSARDLEARCTVGRDQEGWNVELSIPLAALGTPAGNTEWGFNLGRNHGASGIKSTWAPLAEPAFHRPAEFGRLRFATIPAARQLTLWLDFEVPDSRMDVNHGPGRHGQGLLLDGKQFYEMPSAPANQLRPHFSVAAWVKPASIGARIVDKTTVGKDDGYLLDLHPENRVRFITPFGTLTTDEKIPLDEWTHLAAVLDTTGRTMRIYINGIVAAESPMSPKEVTETPLPLRIGADSRGGSRFSGTIDEVLLFHSAIPPEVIAELAR